MQKVNIKSIAILTLLCFFSLQVCAQIVIESKKFEAEGITNIEVQGSFVDVWLKMNNGEIVSFDGKIEGSQRYKGDFEIKSDLEGSTLKIWLERPRNVYGNIDGRWDITIPKGTIVNISNSSGNLYAKGLSGEEILLSTSSGNIEVKNLIGNISLKASSGNITGVDLEGNVSAKASSGNLNLADVIGNLRL